MTKKRNRDENEISNEENAVEHKRPAISVAHKTRSSALLRPVRTIGVVTTGIPFALQKLGKADFAAVSVGKQFHIYDLKNLRIAFISPALTEKIKALHWIGETVLATLKHDIVAFHKLSEVVRLRGHKSAPTQLLSLGGKTLVSSTGKETLVWDLTELELLKVENATGADKGTIEPHGRLNIVNASIVNAICHPPTYLNKIVVGTQEGTVHLYNVRTLKHIHTFNLPRHGAVTSLVAAPSQLDIIAVGYNSGHIVIFNAKTDSVITTFTQSEGEVTTLSFRSDGPGNLVSGSVRGQITVWDLESKSMVQQVQSHEGPVLNSSFIEGQPLLLSSGHDNALILRVFEAADGRCRLLRQRKGFTDSIRKIRFYNNKGLDLICSSNHLGVGEVGRLSTIQQHQNMVFAQSCAFKNSKNWNALNSKLPGVEDISFSSIRHYDWPAIVSSHHQKSEVHIWSAANRALIPKKLAVPGVSGNIPITAVHVSQCGNYCVVGMENGRVHRFNVQSARHVGEFEIEDKKAHSGKVTVVYILPTLEVLSVSTTENVVRIWDLKTHELINSVQLQENALRGVVHGSLLALATHHGVTIIDVMQRNIVRRFPVENMVFITDMGFSPDGRWLAVSTNESRLFIFDLPAARCIDTIRFRSPALSLAFCPTGAFLYTSHANGKGAVRVWGNKMLFDVCLQAIGENKEIAIDEPGEADDSDLEDAAEIDFKFSSSAEPLEPGALTLSSMPETQWKNILHLDTIKERNKPIAAKSERRKAPFFLPSATIDGAVQKQIFVAEPESKSQILPLKSALDGADTLDLIFVRMLKSKDFDGALAHLLKQTPSGAHLCWSEMGSIAGGDDEDLICSLEFFKYHMDKKHHADVIQTYLNLFLQFHGDILREGVGQEDLDDILKQQRLIWNKVDTQCQKIMCFLKILTQTQAQW